MWKNCDGNSPNGKCSLWNQALSRSNVFRWYGRFRDGREDTEDDPRNGRPTGCRNENNVEKISQLLLQNRHLSHVWIRWPVPFARQRPVAQRDNHQAVFGPTKSHCARPPSVFARFSTCWLLFVPKSVIPLQGESLWLDFGHPESRDKYINLLAPELFF